jgi:dolichol kinase
MDPLTYFWIFISYFGDIAYWLGFTVSFLMIYPFLDKKDKKKQKWILYYLLPAVLLSYASAFFLKLIFKVPRVCAGMDYCPETYAFPSGHVAIAFAFSTIVFLWFKRRPKIYAPVFFLSLLICYSRLALKVHSLVDVMGGAIIGVMVSTSWYVFFKKITSGNRSLSFYMRKLIHLAGIIIILLRLSLEAKYVFGFMLFLTLMFFVSEILRIRKIYLPVIHEITNFCKKKEEKGFLIEVFLFSLSITLLLLLPSKMFLIGSLPLIIGDSFAGIIGYTFGKHRLPYNKNKTIEGSLAFFTSTLIAYLIFFEWETSLILSIFSTLVESLLKKYENLLLPFGVVIFYALILI